MPRRKSISPIALLLLAGLLLTACDLGGPAGPTLTASPAASAAPSTPAGVARTPGPAGASSPGPVGSPAAQKVLRFPQGSDPQTTDPQLMSDFNEVAWGQLAFEALLEPMSSSNRRPARPSAWTSPPIGCNTR